MPHTIGLAALNVSCQRGGRVVFRDLSFELSPGQALLVTGPNGAGKTSLLRQMAGLLPLAGGDVRLDGAGPEAELPELCHYVGHLNAVKTSLSVGENLAFWAKFLGANGARLAPALDAAALKLLDAAIASHLDGGGIAIVASHVALGTKFAKKLTLGKEAAS